MSVSYYYRHSQAALDEEEWLTADKMAVSMNSITMVLSLCITGVKGTLLCYWLYSVVLWAVLLRFIVHCCC